MISEEEVKGWVRSTVALPYSFLSFVVAIKASRTNCFPFVKIFFVFSFRPSTTWSTRITKKRKTAYRCARAAHIRHFFVIRGVFGASLLPRMVVVLTEQRPHVSREDPRPLPRILFKHVRGDGVYRHHPTHPELRHLRQHSRTRASYRAFHCGGSTRNHLARDPPVGRRWLKTGCMEAGSDDSP